jgi:hypothetical protein
MTGEPEMARTLAILPEGSRITDYVSLGVITKTFPLKRGRRLFFAYFLLGRSEVKQKTSESQPGDSRPADSEKTKALSNK